MNLSEVMRLGVMAIPQTRPGAHVVFSRRIDGTPCAACAFGTILIAAGLPENSFQRDGFGEAGVMFPLLTLVVKDPTAVTNARRPVGEWISILFELRRWTREQIADWVESIERAQDQSQAGREETTAVLVPTAASAAQKEI